jgi:thiamine biosynthesis lipoprotein
VTVSSVAPIHLFEGRSMGSPLRLAVHGGDPAGAAGLWAAVTAEFEAAEEAMSRFRETSDLTRVNRAAGKMREPVRVDRRLFIALGAAHRAGRLTGARFDARVLSDLERLGYRGASIPGVQGSRPTDDWLALGRDGTAAVRVPVDLGGIGKGLALRWARAIAGRILPPSGGALIEAGGDIAAVGGPADTDRWRIEIEDATGLGEPPAVVEMRDAAMATSSLAVNRWRAPDGRLVHHLIDPCTGGPGGAGLLSVTVAGPDPAWAEVWSKALFLEGAQGIADLARSRGLAAWWIRTDGALEMTSPARVRTAWTARD